MHLNLRAKLLIGFITIDIFISIILGMTMYNQSIEMFISDFRSHKLTIAQYIAASISGDKHREFKTRDHINDPEYKRYYKLIRDFHGKEDDIHFVYTLNYDDKKNELFYGIDTLQTDSDTVWVESPDLGFKFSEKDGQLYFEHNDVQYKDKASIKDLEGRKVKIEIKDVNQDKKLFIENQEVLKVISIDPLVTITQDGLLDSRNRERKLHINIDGKLLEFSVSFTDKGTPGSDPGALFVEDFELKESMKKYIRTNTDFIDKEPRENAYGFFLGAYSIIKNSKDEAIGIVVVDISRRKIHEFKEKFTIVAVSTSLVVFILISLVSMFLAKYFTLPLELLSKAVETLAAGNLESYVEIDSRDEFGKLAKSFNVMVSNLKIASDVQYNLLIEITQLNENLEQKVKERTKKIEEQSSEIDKQIQITRKIQLSLLPEAIPVISNASVSFKYQPMMGVGGDFLDFDIRHNGELKLFICDVSGHGIPAAFLASMVKMALQDCYELHLDPVESLMKVHRVLKGKMKGHFLSAIFCQIDLDTGLMRTANAGHLPMIHLKKNGEAVFFSSKGRIIHELFDPNPLEENLLLELGDKIVLYTDGITESRNTEHEMYGEERLLDLVSKNYQLSTQDLCNEIYDSVLRFTENSKLQIADDITILVAEYNKNL